MRKNRIRIIAVFLGISGLLAFFGSSERVADAAERPSGEMEEENAEMRDKLQHAGTILLQDETETMYDPPLRVFLTKEETEAFASISDTFELAEGSLKMIRFYNMAILNDSGQVLDEWTVDAAHNVINAEGYKVDGGQELEKWLLNMETAHEITYGLLSRAPGEQYFCLLPQAVEGHLSEQRKVPTEEGVEYDLYEEEILELAALGNDLQTDSTRNENIDTYYILNLYDENGAELYSFSVDRDGGCYCNQYPVSGAEIKSFFGKPEEENDL